jgi:aspartyl-tRNA(Asn)/glutamyl-tRNA(Gln) amidotransferase subunit A
MKKRVSLRLIVFYNMNLEKITIKGARDLLKSKKISSLEMTRFFLDRIKKFDGDIRSCISVFEEEAEQEAQEADERIARGEEGDLLGIPYLLKDNMLVKNRKTTAASKMLENYIAPYDSSVARKLREAGAVLLAKTNLDEFAHGSSTENSAFFTTRNPWDLERVPGGSSGGSAAAVAAGFAVFALGSDTGGSVRQPASFCGLNGLKPSYGRVSRFGLMSMASSTDVIGPLTKTAEDAAIVLKCIAGRDSLDLSSSSEKVPDYLENINKKPGKIKLGVFRDLLEEGLSEDVKEGIFKAIDTFKSLGVEIVDMSFPYNKYALSVYYIITPSEISSNLARLDGLRYGFSWDYNPKGRSEKNLNEIYSKNRGDSLGSEVKRRIILGTYILSSGHYDAYYKKGMAVRKKIAEEYNKVFSRVDAVLTPVSAHTAFKIGEQKDDPLKMYLEDLFSTGPSLAGLSAISIPAGFSNGLPFGLQLFSDKFKEETLFNLAHSFQKESDFHQYFPEL